MVILLIFCILIIIIFTIGIIKNCSVHNEIIEKFNEEMYIDMSSNDKHLYFKIIENFKKNLNRSPSIDELYSEFKKIKNNKKTFGELTKQLKNSDEYKNMLEGDEYVNAYHPVEEKDDKDFIDEKDIKTILSELMPLHDIEDIYDENNISFLIMKYRSMNKNKDKFMNYILLTPEYKDYCSIYDKRDFSTDTLNKMAPLATKKDSNLENVDNDDEYVDEEDSYVVPILASSISSTPLSYNINRPDTNNRKTLSIKKECKFEDEFTNILNNSGDSLAKTQIKRNFDELMYHCHKEGSGCELNYKNEDIN